MCLLMGAGEARFESSMTSRSSIVAYWPDPSENSIRKSLPTRAHEKPSQHLAIAIILRSPTNKHYGGMY